MNKQTIIDAIRAYRAAVKMERKVYRAISLLAMDVESVYVSEADVIKGSLNEIIKRELGLEDKIEDIFDCEATMTDIVSILEEESDLKTEQVYEKVMEIVRINTTK